MNSEAKEKNVSELLRTRGSNFSSANYAKSGGTRDLYHSYWGPNKELGVLVKVDKDKFSNSRAEKHFNRGYNTKNELEVMVVGGHNSGVARIIDYFGPDEASKVGLKGVVVAEEEIPDSVGLEEKISQDGPLDHKAYVEVFSSGVGTLNRKISRDGVYHRDIKPSNWLIRQNPFAGQEKSVIVDWANACKKENLKKSYLPTAGGRSFSDPLLMGPFIDEDSSYSDQSEIYSVVATMLNSIRGTPVFNYDPDAGKAIAWDNGETVLSGGKLDKNKHNFLLKKSIEKLPKKFKKYKDLFYKGMTLNEDERFSSFGNFSNEFNYILNKKSFAQKAKKGALVAAAVVLPVVGGLFYLNSKSNLETSERKNGLKDKMFLIDNYRNGRLESIQDFVARDELDAWIDTLKDENTAYAAFMNSDIVYEAIQESGGNSSFDSIRRYLRNRDVEMYDELSRIVYTGIDSWMMTMEDKGKETVDKKLKEAEKKYNEKQRDDSLFQKNQDNMINVLNKIKK